MQDRQAYIETLVDNTTKQIFATLTAMVGISKPEHYAEDTLCYMENVRRYLSEQMSAVCKVRGGSLQKLESYLEHSPN